MKNIKKDNMKEDINLSVATNWDFNLIEELKNYSMVKEVFGVMQKTLVGSARPYFIIANPAEEEVAKYIKQVHSSGKEFNYLLNGACMNNMEYDKTTHQELIKYLQWLSKIDVDSVTVTIPYLIEIIKQQFPNLKVKVSVIAHVNSVQRAKFFEMLGVDSITLDPNINRDFKLIEKIRKAVKCELTLIVNEPCLYQCPFRYYHYNLLAHSTQPYNLLEGFYIDYCILRCTIIKLTNPTEIIKARWIRPEDIYLYEKIGINSFKISGRRMSTKWLLNVVNAYSKRKYEGNLFDVLNGVTPGVDPDIQSPQYQTFLKQSELLEREKLLKLGQMYPVKPYIDNQALQSFIDFFRDTNCLSDCNECNYCQKIAEKVVKIDASEASRYIFVVSDFLKNLTTSKIFMDKPAEEQTSIKEMEWDKETKIIFEEVIQNIPEIFRDIAEKTVGKTAEFNAKKRGSQQVKEEDLVRAFLNETPEAYKTQMINDLKSRSINVSKYMEENVL